MTNAELGIIHAVIHNLIGVRISVEGCGGNTVEGHMLRHATDTLYALTPAGQPTETQTNRKRRKRKGR